MSPVELVVQALQSLRACYALGTSVIEDIILDVVAPAGEQGLDIARPAALIAGYGEGVPGVQIDRFRSSGLEAECLGERFHRLPGLRRRSKTGELFHAVLA